MEKINLKAEKRKIIGKKVKQLRRNGKIPANLYGQGKRAQNLTLDLTTFEKVYKKAGGSALVDLTIDNQKPIKILIHEPQYDPISNMPIHVDMYKIKMNEEITTEIPLEFIGISPAVKEQEGNLIKNKDSVEVECLPGDLISHIDVDISVLKTFDDIIHVKDLNVPENIKVKDDPEETVAVVNAPISEEELKAMEEETAADEEKEGIEKMKAEEESEKEEKEGEKKEGETKEKPTKDEKPTDKSREQKE